jgi:hypothetical protein
MDDKEYGLRYAPAFVAGVYTVLGALYSYESVLPCETLC